MKEPVKTGSFFMVDADDFDYRYACPGGSSVRFNIAVKGFSRYLNHILLAFDGGVSPL